MILRYEHGNSYGYTYWNRLLKLQGEIPDLAPRNPNSCVFIVDVICSTAKCLSLCYKYEKNQTWTKKANCNQADDQLHDSLGYTTVDSTCCLYTLCRVQ